MSAAKMTGKSELIGVRLEHELVAQLDEFAEKLSQPGLSMNRSDALRVAVTTGLAFLGLEGDARRNAFGELELEKAHKKESGKKRRK